MTAAPDASAPPLDAYGLDSIIIDAVVEALDRGDAERVRTLVDPLHPAETADLIELLTQDERQSLVAILRDSFDPEILAELDERVRDEVMEALGTSGVAAALSELDSDDAVYLIEDLDAEEQREILDAVPAEDRVILEQGLTYPEGSAGRLMQRELVAIPMHWNVGQCIDFARRTADLPDDFYDLFVVDPKHKPLGQIALSRLLRSERPVPVTDLLETDFKRVGIDTDQSEVAFLFRKYRLVSAPVVDHDGRLVGVITVDDVVEVIEDQASEDILHLGGVSETSSIYSAVLETTRARFSWLLVNLLTALIASAVIGLFEDSIEKVVALAVLAPIVASMGGNAGTQTLTIAVRALATHELTRVNALRVIGKEILVGGANGFLFAILTGVIAALWFQSWVLGSVIGAAMIVNLISAAAAGVAIPIGLDRLGVDPAVASGVFLTTVTDVVGFFAFLGLATWLLL